jgi:hypothetical protein
MPIHDWTRVYAGVFHDFHNAWIVELSRTLNVSLLPDDYYALGEGITDDQWPDDLTLRVVASEDTGGPTEAELYIRRQRTLVIRHVSDHRIIALVEIVSPGNKASRQGIRSFLDKALAALAQGIHLLLLDLQPPSPRDPQGIHGLRWEELTGEVYEPPSDKPLTLAAYDAGPPKVAYVEAVAVGDVLPVMPLFLAPEQYINVPLEPTYAAAYEGVPRFYRSILERPSSPA